MAFHVNVSLVVLLLSVSLCLVSGQTEAKRPNQQRAGPECRLPMDPGNCIEALDRFFYNISSGRCEKFTYTSCGGNLNNFETRIDCHQRCLCSLPKRSGSCRLDIPRYYYNAQTGTCDEFSYSGCGGNPNNFASKRECLGLCDFEPRDPAACQKRPDIGTCSNKIQRYYFDFNCQCCRSFFWSGCGGRKGNNFATYAKCAKRCNAITTPPPTQSTTITPSTTTPATTTTTAPPTTTTVVTTTVTIPPYLRCYIQPDKGTCNGSIWQYYYDTRCQCCRVFEYSGCGGNENRFMTIQGCRQACAK